MAGITLDSGPLIAFEQRDRRIEAWIAEAVERSEILCVPLVVIAEIWRGGARSARIARALSLCDVWATDENLAKQAGVLLSSAKSNSTVDALVVATAAQRHDRVLTTDPDDLQPLAQAAGIEIAIL